jgi:hypothetical protein
MVERSVESSYLVLPAITSSFVSWTFEFGASIGASKSILRFTALADSDDAAPGGPGDLSDVNR